jgi:hypothetical protein
MRASVHQVQRRLRAAFGLIVDSDLRAGLRGAQPPTIFPL